MGFARTLKRDESPMFQGEGQEQELNPKQRSAEVSPGEVPGGDAKGGSFSGDLPSQSKEGES